MRGTVFLCGFMGCGKSTVGRKLAALRGTPFCDLDDEIVRRCGQSIPSLFAAFGEAGFREREAAVLRTVAAEQSGAVIATGGGALLRQENADFSRKAGWVVFLDVPFDTCFSRISGDANRPLAADASRAALLARYTSRRPVYLACADFALCPTAGEAPAQLAERIFQYEIISRTDLPDGRCAD